MKIVSINTMRQFKINEYITLKLIGKKTVIFVKNKEFKQCKYLLINVSTEDLIPINEIESIDEASEKLNKELEKVQIIPPEVEFWGHCSNLQVWAEQKYKSNILHRTIAFPLLKKLFSEGDPIAKKVFKKEIATRLLGDHFKTAQFLIDTNYLEYLDNSEIKTLIYEAFDKMKSRLLYLLFRRYYFKTLNEKETYDLYEEYYLRLTEQKDKKISELFQHIAINEIKKQFPSEDELFIAYEDELSHMGDVITLEIRNKYGQFIKLNNIFGIEYLIKLKRLTLNNIVITDIDQIEKMESLEYLVLSSCSITEIKGFEDLKNLKKLDLSYNEISNMKGLSTLKNLKELKIDNNKIKKLQGLESLVNLDKLHLQENEISEISGLKQLSTLTELNLSSNKIKEMKGLENLTNLKVLNLSNNQISEIKGLDSTKSLEELNLSYNKIEMIKNLDHLINLKILDLYYNKISNTEYLKKLKKGIFIGLDENLLKK